MRVPQNAETRMVNVRTENTDSAIYTRTPAAIWQIKSGADKGKWWAQCTRGGYWVQLPNGGRGYATEQLLGFGRTADEAVADIERSAITEDENA